MQSLFSKITRGVIHCRRLYHHRPRGQVFSIQLCEVGSVREHLPLQTWIRFMCVKAPEGGPLPDSVPVPVPVPVLVPVQVPVPEPVPSCVTETAAKSDTDPEVKVKGDGDLWGLVYTGWQNLATILATLAALCTIFGYMKLDGEKKSSKVD